jgi:hypothetical protein
LGESWVEMVRVMLGEPWAGMEESQVEKVVMATLAWTVG